MKETLPGIGFKKRAYIIDPPTVLAMSSWSRVLAVASTPNLHDEYSIRCRTGSPGGQTYKNTILSKTSYIHQAQHMIRTRTTRTKIRLTKRALRFSISGMFPDIKIIPCFIRQNKLFQLIWGNMIALLTQFNPFFFDIHNLKSNRSDLSFGW